MLKRLVGGAVIGLLVGALTAFAVVRTLGTSFLETGTILAYVLAAVTGLLTGLVAGKPIWSQTGKIEAGLKAFFGAVASLGLLLAIRTWGNMHVDLSFMHAGQGMIKDLPAAALPIIATVLAAFFGADNTPEVQGAEAKVRVGTGPAESVSEEQDDGSSSAKKMGR